MNPNVLLGVTAFIVWSTFSTWYYVTYIKQFPEENVAEIPVPEEPEPEKETEAPVDSIQAPEPINMLEAFTFKKNSVELTNEEAFEAFKERLQSLDMQRPLTIHLIGYTCDLGTEAHNKQLGQKRADWLMKALSLPASISIKTTSMGEQNPAVPNDSEANRQLNRKVTISIKSAS